MHAQVREIWLSSEDTGAYGRDIGTDIAQLLNRLTLSITEVRARVLAIKAAAMMPPVASCIKQNSSLGTSIFQLVNILYCSTWVSGWLGGNDKSDVNRRTLTGKGQCCAWA